MLLSKNHKKPKIPQLKYVKKVEDPLVSINEYTYTLGRILAINMELMT